MKLNRYNYEEYFILYMDNELDSESRLEVEAFAQENPDLKAELDILMHSKLTPDDDISFSDKASLMRFHNSTISLNNYEEWLIAYIDNELSEEDIKDAERFIAGNPSIQRELNLLQRAKLQPEAIVFPHKESLYRKEEKARVIAFSWRRIAVAAVFLLAISTTAIVLINNKKDNSIGGGSIVKKKPDQQKPDNTITPPVNETTDKNQETALSNKKETEPAIKANSNNTTAITQKDKPEEKKEQAIPLKNETPVIAYVPKEETQTNDLPKSSDENANATGKSEINNGTNDSPKEAGLTNDKPEKLTGNVTPETLKPSYAVEQQSSGNKGIRGFLRKVTRTIEKRTNIKATDDDDRLLVAGLAIKL